MSDERRPLVVAVVGYHNVGKTTVATRMVTIWTSMGLNVGTVKHDGHADQGDADDWEKPGSDTERMRQAGASITMVAGGGQSLLRTVRDPQSGTVEDLVDRLESHAREIHQPLDVILVEGYKKSALPKVAVVTPGEREWVLEDRLENVAAVVFSPLREYLPVDSQVASFTQKRLRVYHESNLQDLCESLWLRHSR